ncbi:MAG: pilus assembly protein PilP [Syntrophales bacterium]|nr:pilus assembly protein PilP [Syntrophales bacterium]
MKKRSKVLLSGFFIVSACIFVWVPGTLLSAPPAAKPSDQSVQTGAKAAVTPVAPVDAPSPLVFSYDPKGKPDPFKPFVDAELAFKKKQLEKKMLAQKQAELKRQQQQKAMPLSPLQRQALDQFKLVGIAGNNRVRKAIVQDVSGSGKYYPIYIGTLIGLSSARVVEIRESSVLLEEPKSGGAGKSGRKYVEMKLRKEGDEGAP